MTGYESKKAAAQAKVTDDEPVAWMDSDWHYQLHKKGMVVAHKDKGDVLIKVSQPLYTRPQPATWVGLTQEEHYALADKAGCMSADWVDYAKSIEQALKEKNA